MQSENRQPAPPVITTRVLPCKRERVFRAWSDPQWLAQWWGPNGFTPTFTVFDFKEGGEWKFTLDGPDGTNYPKEIRFTEIAAPRKIVLHHLGVIHTFTVTAVLEDLGEKTGITFNMVFDELRKYEKLRDLVTAANEENLSRLEKLVTGLN